MQYHFKSLRDLKELPGTAEDSIKHSSEILISLLKKSGILTATLPKKYEGNELAKPKSLHVLFDLLNAVGKIDLNLGRIYEGHVNALLLIDLYGSKAQKKLYFSEAVEHKLFGVWNTERNYDPLQISEKTSHTIFLKGSKVFCSGGSSIDYPIISVCEENAHQLLIFNNSKKVLINDLSTWNPIGMRSSLSCRIDFTGMSIKPEELLGDVNCYFLEPHFVGGSIRFSAVQLGGAQRIADITFKNLRDRKRLEDPYQKKRIAEIIILLESGKNWLHSAAKRYVANHDKSPQTFAAYARMVRTAITDICYKVMNFCERSLGVSAFNNNPEFSKTYQDLLVYLKQPAPDSSLIEVAEFIKDKKSLTDVR